MKYIVILSKRADPAFNFVWKIDYLKVPLSSVVNGFYLGLLSATWENLFCF